MSETATFEKTYEAKYEAMIIFTVANSEEETQGLLQKFKALVEENGNLESVDEWGKRRLAYPINDEPDGYYVLLNFASEPDFPQEFERIVKITDGALRSLVIRKA